MTLRALASSSRPAHAWKNVPVAAAAVFGGRLGDPAAVRSVVACFVAFCLVASAGYLVNDVRDLAADRAHPVRRSRAIARGDVPVPTALATAAVLGAAGLALAWTLSTRAAAAVLAAYGATTLVYTFAGKRIAAVAVAMIAAGFVLRVLAGAFAASVAPSPWLLGLTAVLALALAIAKRESEDRRVHGESGAALRRGTDTLLALSLCGYVAYALAPDTVALHGTRALVWTAVPVGAALVRFRARLRADRTGAGPAELVARDPLLLALGAAWIVACALLA